MVYTVKNIKYDTDGEDINLPPELDIIVPDKITSIFDIDEYLSDKISDLTGFCHFGFTYDKKYKL